MPFGSLCGSRPSGPGPTSRAAFSFCPTLTPGGRACVSVLGGIYSKLLDRIEAADYDVFNRRVSLSTTEKLGVMAQSWATGMWPRRIPDSV